MNQEPHLDSNSQAVLREKGVIPATIGILKGQVHAARWSDGIFETLIDLVDFGCLVFCWLEIPREEDTAHVGMAFGSLQNWEGWRLDDGMHIGFPISGWSLNPSDHNLGTRLSFWESSLWFLVRRYCPPQKWMYLVSFLWNPKGDISLWLWTFTNPVFFGPSKQKIWGWNDCCTIGGFSPRLGMMGWRRRISPPSWWFESMVKPNILGRKALID